MRTQKRPLLTAASILALLANSAGVAAQDGAAQPKTKERSDRVIMIDREGATRVLGPGGDPLHIGIQGPAIGFPPEVVASASGDGYTYSFVSSEMSFDNKVVKGAPYSAEAVTETVQTLGDGNRIVRRTTSAVHRDGEGRTRREQALGAVGPWGAAGDSPQTVFVNDPVAGVNFVLDPRSRTARKLPNAFGLRGAIGGVPPGAVTLPLDDHKLMESKVLTPPKKINLSGGVLQGSAIKKVQPSYPPVAKAAGAEGPVQVQVTVSETGQVVEAVAINGHPLLREAATEAARQWVFKPTELGGTAVKVNGVVSFNFTLGPNESQPGTRERVMMPGAPGERVQPKTESLGKQTIEGVEAEGTRTTITIPAGQIGNERPIEIVSERWYSPELQTVVMTRRNDPRSGEHTYRLTNISRAEPDRSLFEVPSDYTVREEFPRMPEVRMRRPGNEN